MNQKYQTVVQEKTVLKVSNVPFLRLGFWTLNDKKAQPTFTYSKSAIEVLEKDVKYVQS